MSRSKTKTSSTSNQTAVSTPNVPSWLQGPAQNYVTQVSSLLNSGAQSPISSLQTQAVNSARGLGSDTSAMTDAQGTTRGLLNYTPDSVTAGQLADTDLSRYMDPYQSQVIDSLLGDFAHANDLGLNSLRSMTPNGAYGGSRQAVSAGQLVGDNTRSLAGTIAGLRSQGFQNAQQGAMFDIGNRYNADTFNSQQGLAGAGLRLGAANQLGNMGLAADENQRQNLATQSALGEVERNNSPEAQRIQFLQQIAQMLGFNPADYIGQTVTQNGTSSGSSSTSGFSLGWSPSGGFRIGG